MSPDPKLKLTDLAEDKPIRLTIELPAAVHRDLVAYAAILGGASGKSAIAPEKLIAPMITRFMATDRAFAKSTARETGGSRCVNMRTEHLNFSGARCLCPKYILKGGVGKRVQCRIAGAGKVVLVILH